MQLKIEYVPIETIRPYARNAKLHPIEQLDQIAESIKEAGFCDPIGVWQDEIVEGHGRLQAAQRIGLKEVPIIRLDHLTDEQRRAYMLIHNQTTMNSGWDLDMLQEELAKITDIDMESFGFDLSFEEPEKEVEEDEAPEPPIDPITKPGDVYKLGDHILICGDATDPETIRKLMQGQKADLYLTDPPYNVDYEGGTGLKIMNDSMEDSKFRAFLVDAFKAADANLKPGGAFYIWHADSEGFNFRAACREAGWEVRQCLIWNKSSLVLGRQDYQWKHEPCLYGWKDGKGHYFIDDRTQSTVYSDKEEIKPRQMKKDELIRLVEAMLAQKTTTTVIDEEKPARSAEHPTMKPVKLMARLIRNSSKPGERVLDSFGGSGSTMIACEQLNRRCFMTELSPNYCDVIVERWENFTGRKAEREE